LWPRSLEYVKETILEVSPDASVLFLPKVKFLDRYGLKASEPLKLEQIEVKGKISEPGFKIVRGDPDLVEIKTKEVHRLIQRDFLVAMPHSISRNHVQIVYDSMRQQVVEGNEASKFNEASKLDYV
jgi:hypothetical protein